MNDVAYALRYTYRGRNKQTLIIDGNPIRSVGAKPTENRSPMRTDDRAPLPRRSTFYVYYSYTLPLSCCLSYANSERGHILPSAVINTSALSNPPSFRQIKLTHI